jgi:cytochrome P450
MPAEAAAARPQGPVDTIDFSSEEFQTRPWAAYARLRADDPIHWSPVHRCFFVMRYAHALFALESPAFVVDHPFRATRNVLGPTVLDLDGETHARLHGAMAPPLRRTAVESFATRVIEPTVEALLDDLAAAGRADFMKAFAERLPIRIITAFLGVPAGLSDLLSAELAYIVAYVDDPRAHFERALRARDTLLATLRDVATGDAAKAPDTYLGHLMHAHRVEGTLDLDEVLRALLLMLAAGTETSVCAMGNTLRCLLEHPAALAAARRDPALVGGVVRETLRWEPPMHMTLRIACQDVLVGGTLIRKGIPVQVCLASANRDETVYERAAAWEPARRGRAHLSFGAGRHACLGIALAQKELEVVFRLLLRRFTRIEPDGELPPIRGKSFRRPGHLPVRLAAG